MDLIYADVVNGEIIDRGILNNYAFDISFGEDENNFQLKCPMEGTKLEEDQIIYISGTEYGGIIDSIEVDTANLKLIYTGRTWHGILENKILYPPKGTDYLYVNGDANDVLRYLLEIMNIIPGENNELFVAPAYPFMSVSEEDSGIDIEMRVSSESGNYAHGYTFIRDMLYANDAKLQIIDGVLSAVPLVDYSNDDDFLEGTDQFKAKRNYNSLNRLHCMGTGNLSQRHTIDLYLDSNGGLLPYCRTNPVQDSDYYTDIEALSHSTDPEDVANFRIISQHMVTGANEIADIYDYPSIQDTFHYVGLTAQPSDWAEDLTPNKDLDEKEWGFQKYFQMQGANDYKNIEKPEIMTRFDLQLSAPGDWKSKFNTYYEKTANGFVNVEAVENYVPVSTMPSGWYTGAYSNYYTLDGSSYVQVQQVPGLVPLTSQPGDWTGNWSAYALADGSRVPSVIPDPVYTLTTKQPGNWKTNYGDYYTTDGVNFNNVSGVTKTKKRDILTTYKPSDWASSYKNYWYKSGKKWVHPPGKNAPPWKANKYYMDRQYTTAPKWEKQKYYSKKQDEEHAPDFVAGMYYANGYVVPTWGSINVFEKNNVPTWTYNKYYTAVQYQPIPTFILDTYFKQYTDHYEALVEAAKNKIAEYMSKNKLEITLDDKRIYDINDRVGASDEVTGIRAVERIVQKIVKIERGIVSFDYNTGT